MMIDLPAPHIGLQRVLLLAQLVMSLLIVMRLMFYRKKHARHKVHMSLVAYLLLVAYGWTAIRILTGEYLSPVDWSDLAVNAAVLLAVFYAKGNIARFLMTAPSAQFAVRVSGQFPARRNPTVSKETKL
ncbi:phage holin family protein [Herbaspirillum sp. NPDC101396]|uniref:phage holin family protein n=1 Tax=Herbaspirillum sp. NPDC101396 TaxID=3364005 RepID=UPI00383B5E2B